ncbi:glycoside hydrolase family 25 protein [Algoriphagus sediminis]|uniref:Glycoside hydrolase family 25 protein n=1 Tax=Algoriphagus sediminis TaxID=3057113 RepID=A0ABT7YE60_9BACT|nr:glycoside hydrolase family 25 protein [Algoriphagus sediminis]MDN3204816.1 glycoside hydrolase family 25 protein [Algoriphagus sediminis]
MRGSLIWVICFGLILFSCGSNEESKTVESTPPQTENTAPETIEKNENQTRLGIDVSHFQGDIDWNEIKEAGILFAYDKATQGETYVDPDYKENHIGAKNAGLVHGSYHFFMSNDDPIKQAKLFLANALYEKGDLPPVLDLESGGIKGEITREEFEKNVLAWLEYVEAELGVKPIVYTNHSFGDQYLSDGKLAEYHLWVAEYGVDKPKVPKVWEEQGWLIWQRTERGTVEGAIGQVDHDLYNPEKPAIVEFE